MQAPAPGEGEVVEQFHYNLRGIKNVVDVNIHYTIQIKI